MEFGVLFTSHPNPEEEPYPHRDVHARTTDEIVEAERLGFDTAWIAQHHFHEDEGGLPAPFVFLANIDPRLQLGGPGFSTALPDWSAMKEMA